MRLPPSPLSSAWFLLSFFTSLEKADPQPHAPECAGLGVFSRHFFLKQIQMCTAAVPRGAPPISQIAGQSLDANKNMFIFISFVGSNMKQKGGQGKAREGRRWR